MIAKAETGHIELPQAPPSAGGDLELRPAIVWKWLAAGWADLMANPVSSLAYGALVWLGSVALIACLFKQGYDAVLFPLLSGFLVVGPFIALGLYEKSRRLALGEPTGLRHMIWSRPASGAQILFTGVLLGLLMLAWMRSAVLIYALFFGLRPFPGLDRIVPMLFGTPIGWAILLTGSVVGAIFAAFSFAISIFALPMQLAERTDALTAMGRSMVAVWRNLPVMLSWGAVVASLFALSVATGLLGLIIVFPLLGHATWHAYRDMAAAGRIP